MAFTASGFGDGYPFDRLWRVSAIKQFLSYSRPVSLEIGWQFFEAHAVDACTAFVLGYSLQGNKQVRPAEYAFHPWNTGDRSVFFRFPRQNFIPSFEGQLWLLF